MSMQVYDVEASRTSRATTRASAHRSIQVWQDEVLAALAALTSAALGGTSADQVALFDAVVHEPNDDDEDGEFRDELTAVTLVSSQGRVTLGRGTGPGWAWAEAVDLWDDLRQVLSCAFQMSLPGGLLVDLGPRTVYLWEPFYCPDEGDAPDHVLELVSEQDDADPFAALLAGPRPDDSALVERYEALMARYALAPPSVPSHEPGQCWDDESD